MRGTLMRVAAASVMMSSVNSSSLVKVLTRIHDEAEDRK
jgi:hypothetical protein